MHVCMYAHVYMQTLARHSGFVFPRIAAVFVRDGKDVFWYARCLDARGNIVYVCMCCFGLEARETHFPSPPLLRCRVVSAPDAAKTT